MSEKDRERAFYRRLREQGLWISRTEYPRPAFLSPFKTIEVKGKPLPQ